MVANNERQRLQPFKKGRATFHPLNTVRLDPTFNVCRFCYATELAICEHHLIVANALATSL